MLTLRNNEKTIRVVHKHWFVMARTALVCAFLIAIPPIILTLLPLFTQDIDHSLLDTIVNFGLSLYIMVLLLFALLAWMDYYLDLWIVTSERLIDIEQNGLFNREVTELPLANIEDITIEVHGIIETFLKFGTLKVQTAGKGEFSITSIPHPYEVKDAILSNIPRAQKETASPASTAAPHI